MAHKVLVNLDIFSPTPLYQQVALELTQCIVNGRLSPGERLPSIREFSRQLRLSADTVKQALELLNAEGLVVSWPGSGNYVNKALAPDLVAPKEVLQTTALSLSSRRPNELDPHLPWSAEAIGLASAFNECPIQPWSEPEVEFDFRGTEPSSHVMQGTRWDQTVKRWADRFLVSPHSYSNAAGIPELRQEIVAWLKRTRGIDCSLQDIFITSGVQQARDLASRLLVNKGTEVVVEDPCNISDLLSYKAQGAKLLPIPQDADGINTALLKTITTADIAHVFPTASFPAATTMSADRRQELLTWAQQNDVIVIEDCTGGEYYAQESLPPTIYALAKERGLTNRVIYQGSLSPLMTPSLRLGFAIVPAWLQPAYLRAKWLSERQSSGLTQGLVLTVMQEGFFNQHALRLLESSRRKRKEFYAAIERWPSDLVTYTPVKCGFHQPIWFNEPLNDLLISERALSQSIAVVPLSPHFTSITAKSGLSLSFTNLPEEKIAPGLAKLLAIILDCKSAG